MIPKKVTHSTICYFLPTKKHAYRYWHKLERPRYISLRLKTAAHSICNSQETCYKFINGNVHVVCYVTLFVNYFRKELSACIRGILMKHLVLKISIKQSLLISPFFSLPVINQAAIQFGHFIRIILRTFSVTKH